MICVFLCVLVYAFMYFYVYVGQVPGIKLTMMMMIKTLPIAARLTATDIVKLCSPHSGSKTTSMEKSYVPPTNLYRS